MLNINNFFSPLNLSNISILFFFIFYCEILGYWVSRKFIGEIKPLLRGSIWLIGLGVVVFVYFLSHFYLSYASTANLILLAVINIVPTIFYFKEKAFVGLFNYLKSNVIPIVIVSLIMPIIVVKASMPPYVWDEMAYHFISPHDVYFEKAWNFGSSFYMNLPRLMDTAFISLFSLTNTYSPARLLSFFVFISFLLMAYRFLKEKFGLGLAIAFFAFTLFHPENYLLWSTFGYIDIGTTSFVMIGFFMLLDYFYDRNISSIQYAIIFFALAVGSKYSAVTQLLTFGLITSTLFILRKDYLLFKDRRLFLSLIMFLILGGYWYIKNYFIAGNPIYPILFGCKFEACENIDFGYTFPFTFSNISIISSRIFMNDLLLPKIFISSIVVSLTLGSKKVKELLLLVSFFVFIEVLFLRNISGFEGRYFYHWQIFTVLVTVLPLFVLGKLWRGVSLEK